MSTRAVAKPGACIPRVDLSHPVERRAEPQPAPVRAGALAAEAGVDPLTCAPASAPQLPDELLRVLRDPRNA
jgi:hypothetical protein